MIKNLKKLEKNLGYKLRDDIFCLTIDTATKSGVAIISILKGKLAIHTFLLKIPSLPKEIESKEQKYEEHLHLFYNYIIYDYITILNYIFLNI